LPEATPDRWIVLELGNFMLEGLHPIRRSPHLAIFTNLLPDHMNSYDSMEDYGEAKSSIFRYQGAQDIALFNEDNDVTRRFATEASAGQVWLYSQTRMGAHLRGAESALHPFAYDHDIRLRGTHNLANVQAATLAAELIGVDSETISMAVRGFGGVPHRLEVVRELDGVTYVNDSASTAPVAGIAALRSFSEPIVLIAGGNSKQLDFSEFAAAVAERVKSVVLLKGNATDEFAAAICEAARTRGRPDPVAGTFDELAPALDTARDVAALGDVILLSPGFTSFGMFLHEFDRGDQFRRLVGELSPRQS